MQNTLIIGGAGYIGTALSDYLLKNDYRLKVLDNCIYNNNETIINNIKDKNYEFIFGDMCKIQDIEIAIKNVSKVIILSGLVGDPITKKYPKEANLINLEKMKSLIDFLYEQDLKNLIFVSTCSNYGFMDESMLADEDTELKPLSLYAEAKVSVEKYILEKFNKSNTVATILRFATAFGLSSRMRFDLTINEFTRKLALGESPDVYDAETWRPYCHVNDFARLIKLILETKEEKVYNQVFNSGGDINNYTKQGIINKILEYLPDSNVKYVTEGSDPRNYRVSFQKIRNVLNFEPKYSVEDGVIEIIKSIKAGLFKNENKNINLYGNYNINFKINNNDK